MSTGRMEAFSDGVIAILITVMVLELPTPHGTSWSALHGALPVLLCYVLSFLYLGIYWNNHHHLLHTVKQVSAGVMWANMHLLFWLSLVPVTTGWIGEHPDASAPAVAYGLVLLMCGVAYLILQKAIIAARGDELAEALGSDLKGKLSSVAYLAALGLAFVSSWISIAIYVGVAIWWIVPDRRIERVVAAPASDRE